MIERSKLKKLYASGLSMMEIANKLGCSGHKVDYWMRQHNIPRRSWSEATYVKLNPDGDPFEIKKLKDKKDFRLFYLGIGLYLGEGDKRSKGRIGLANNDPKILKIFLKFLREICSVKESKIGAQLNIFDDIDLDEALKFWQTEIGLKRPQIRTITVRESNEDGTYKNKSKYGTLMIFITNAKLKRIVNEWCSQLTSDYKKN